MKRSPLIQNLLMAFAAALLFIPFLGSVHLFDWDEINFAECAREMIVSGNYSTVQINFFPFWEKPPLFIWMQVLSMKTFGVSEFAARLPNAICGMLTLLIVFNSGRKLYGSRFGALWALAFAGSLLPHFYFKSGIIDPWFNLFIFLSIVQFIRYSNEYENRSSVLFFNWPVMLSALFLSLAVLCKGPVAALIFGLCFVVFRLIRWKPIMHWKHFLLFCLVFSGICGSWFLSLMLKGRGDLIIDFLNYQIRLFSTEDADHGGPLYYHWLVLLIGCFPASVLAIRGFRKQPSDTPYQMHFKRWMSILFWVVLILFSLVKTKIVHYSSLCYFPLTFMAAYTASKLMNGEIEWRKWMTVLTLFIGGVLGLLLTSLQFVASAKEKIIAAGIIHDPFAEANLQADVHWNGFEFLIGLIFLTGIIACAILAFRKKINTAILSLFLLTLVATDLSALVFAPRIEGYSQKTALSFYESLKGQNCYVDVQGFKSYAHLFYSDKQPSANESPLFKTYLAAHDTAALHQHKLPPKETDQIYSNWLREGAVDRPVFIVCKNTHAKEFQEYFPWFEKLSEKNGFVFFQRKDMVSHSN